MTESGGTGTKYKGNWTKRAVGTFGREATGLYKVVTWNIPGIGKVEGAWDFLEKKDVIKLQETWLEEGNELIALRKLNKEFKW